MKPLLIAAACAAALALTGCVTVIDASDDGHYGWTGNDAQPFGQAEDACETIAGSDHGTTAFITCMAERGWTRTRD